MARSRPTSADVAARAGVSRTTVSFVLNYRTDVQISDETRQRVFRAASELGYHPHAPARQLAGGRSNVLGLVLRQSAEQVAGDATLAETLRGLASAARAAGSRVMVEPLAPEGTYDRLHQCIVVSAGDGGLRLTTEPSGVLRALGVGDTELSMTVLGHGEGCVVAAGTDPVSGLREGAVFTATAGDHPAGLYLQGRLHRRTA